MKPKHSIRGENRLKTLAKVLIVVAVVFIVLGVFYVF